MVGWKQFCQFDLKFISANNKKTALRFLGEKRKIILISKSACFALIFLVIIGNSCSLFKINGEKKNNYF